MGDVAAEAFDPIAYINEPRWRASSYGLHRIADLLDRLGRPQDRLRFVHVAGTNGKGSTCAYVERIMREAGYRTGMFTSPYLFRFEERIQVDGACIPIGDLTEVTLGVREAAEEMFAQTGEHATEFELMTAVALVYFAQRACDIAVLEVGLGGLLDSTNVIDAPEVCAITRIGLDHTDLLGDTLPEIARQKAGIVKTGATVVKQADDPEVMAVFEEVCREKGCELVVAAAEAVGPCDDATGLRPFSFAGRMYETRLLGKYQPENAATALAVVGALRSRGWDVPEEAVARGVRETRWPARFEVVASRPTFVVDGGHNPQGAAALAETIRDVFPGRKCVFLMSVLADKDYPAMVRTVLPLASAFVTFTPPNPRALDAADLEAEIRGACCETCANDHDAAAVTQCNAVPASAVDDVAKGVRVARALAGEDGVVVAFGSLYSVGEVIAALGEG